MNGRLIEDYAYYLKVERHMSGNTVSSYISDVSSFLGSYGRDAEDATSDDITDYLCAISDILSPRSQSRLLSALRSFFGWLVVEGDRKDNPCDSVDAPKLSRSLPAVLSVEEVCAIIESVPSGSRDRAILEVLYGCGLRVSELCGLKVSDVYFEEGFLRIVGKGDKERLVPLGEEAGEAMREWLASRPEPAPDYRDCIFTNRFGKPISRVSVFNMVKRQAVAAGVRKEISPHTFRHSFASHLIENGADLRVVQEMLGHESILTTEIYTHIDRRTWQESILSHHPRN